MAETNLRSDAVDVEQIMRQIRARIREKRGTDYTETELAQLAAVKLERFLDPKGVRSDLVSEFKRNRVVSPAPPNYAFEDTTLYETHRGLLRSLRNLLRPVLKLFFNPDKISSALHIQAEVNTQAEQRLRRLEEREPLSYELLHNLTVEITRLGIDVHNLKMRLESLSSRLEFDERRARSLESVVEYKTPINRPATTPSVPDGTSAPRPAGAPSSAPDGAQGERRRRRRRRRRRPGQNLADRQGAPHAMPGTAQDEGPMPGGDGNDEPGDESDDPAVNDPQAQ
jgi:hypothetical protein